VKREFTILHIADGLPMDADEFRQTFLGNICFQASRLNVSTEVSKEVDELHVVANNNRSNYAPKLAEALKQKLGLQGELREKLFKRQGQLI
jgi:hypothetical protein